MMSGLEKRTATKSSSVTSIVRMEEQLRRLHRGSNPPFSDLGKLAAPEVCTDIYATSIDYDRDG